jgi:hypothetical protein
MSPPSLRIDPSLGSAKVGSAALRAALVWASGLPGCPRTELPAPYLAALLERVREAGEAFLPPSRKGAVRDLLRHGKYKPAGRSKPSSEYLLAAALADEFPLVNGPVDANNAVSLEWGYPASIFDLAKTGGELGLRRGLAGESYIFNPSGQTIDLEDLLVVCRRGEGGDEPCGNPVKDAMATKVFEDARDVVAVVYAPACEDRALLEACASRFKEILLVDCRARDAGFELLEGS